jgi:exodeoxyribonuclease VIII
MDLMIDIETLSTRPNAVILNIGAIGFDPFTNTVYDEHVVYHRIDTESQVSRDIDESTVEWWGKQGVEAQNEAFGDEDRVELDEALDNLARLARKCGRIWANGIAFDMTILEDAYKEHNKALPWQYYRVLDARTLYKLCPNAGRLGNDHHALADCVNQVTLLQKCIKQLGVTKIG